MAPSTVNQLQLLRQNLENISLQKQQLEATLTEVESALSVLEKDTKSYKILGKLMLQVETPALRKELEEKKEVVSIRLQNFSSQEDKIKKEMETIQKQLLEELKVKKSGK